MGSASGVCAFLWVKPRASYSANDCCRVRPQPSFYRMIILNISGFHYKVSMHVKFSSPTVFIKLLAYILAKKEKGFIWHFMYIRICVYMFISTHICRCVKLHFVPIPQSLSPRALVPSLLVPFLPLLPLPFW